MMNARYLLPLIIAVLLTSPIMAQHRPLPAPAEISSPTNFVQQPFDVLHYDAWIDLTKAPAREMSGVCEITLRWPGDPASGPFYFHLRGLRIDSAYYNGAATVATEHETPQSPIYHYTITPPATATTGDTAVIRIVYSGTMERELNGTWGGVSASGGTLFAMGVGFNNNYISTTQHWLPCYDHPSDKATFRGRFLVKTGKAVASNGLLTVVPQSDSTTIYDWNHTFPCATYLLTFAVDNYIPVEFPGETPPMVIYSRRADSAATHATFKLLPRMVRGFEQRFGTYPFEKVGYVNTPIGAMEHQTMISFPRSISVSRDTVNSIGAHELAHQWFGDLVSPLDYRHAWLNESFATFCESVWEEELWGWDRYLASQTVKGFEYMDRVAPREGIFPLYDFPRASPSSNYPVTIYEKGAVVVGMLRYELGDSIFFPAIRDYLARHGYGTATTEELRSILEEHAGRSLGWFFDQWIYGKGWPTVGVRTSQQPIGNGEYQVTIQLQQNQADSLPTFIGLPVEIGFRLKTGEMLYRMIRMSERSMTVLDTIPDYMNVTINQGPSVRTLMKANADVSGVDGGSSRDGAEDTGFFVHPNPSTNGESFAVEARGLSDCGNIAYEVYDSSGRHISAGLSGSCQFSIPATNLANGAYLLRFVVNSRPHDVRIVVSR